MKRFFVRSVSAALTLSVMVTGLSSCAQKDSTATGSSASSEVTAQSSDVSAETSESTGSSETSDSGADTPVSYTIDNIRQYVVGVDEPVAMEDGSSKVIINFDNAATTPALKPVMDEVNSKLETYGSIGRGYSIKSNISTEIYDNTREKVLSFVNADPEKYTCVYVNNTTDGLNKLASALVGNKNDVVLATRMEHHANDLSWRERCKVIYAEVDEQG
ncbi:MAG: aminotransferase class V-fold PLP-dependent enzyme, partial [Lachnospiraceae bacterium]|nr:aminotransferase class V-fold PLP-dependent enzyme [Lachnospiraceae bacterium]